MDTASPRNKTEGRTEEIMAATTPQKADLKGESHDARAQSARNVVKNFISKHSSIKETLIKLTLVTDTVANRLTSGIDNLQRTRHQKKLEIAKNSLDNDRTRQVDRLENGGILSNIREFRAKRRMKDDLRAATNVINGARREAKVTGDSINQFVAKHNANPNFTKRLEKIVPSENPMERERKLAALIEEADRIQNSDAINATKLRNLVGDLRAQTVNYEVAMGKRNRATDTARYTGTNNSRNQGAKIEQAQSELGQAEQNILKNVQIANDIKERWKKMREAKGQSENPTEVVNQTTAKILPFTNLEDRQTTDQSNDTELYTKSELPVVSTEVQKPEQGGFSNEEFNSIFEKLRMLKSFRKMNFNQEQSLLLIKKGITPQEVIELMKSRSSVKSGS